MQILQAGGEWWDGAWIATSEVHQSYLDFAAEIGVRRKSAEMQVDRRLSDVFGELREKRRVMVDGTQTHATRFPKLPVARGAFDRYLHADIDW